MRICTEQACMRARRLLMRKPVGLEDLADVAPEVHASLHKLLEYPPEVVDQLDLVFQVCSFP